MRIASLVALTAFALLSACGDDGGGDSDGDEESFDTFQECYDDHVGGEAPDPATAIAICCLDHPIGGEAAGEVCGSSIEFCRNYVNAEISPALDAVDVDEGCMAYIEEQ